MTQFQRKGKKRFTPKEESMVKAWRCEIESFEMTEVDWRVRTSRQFGPCQALCDHPVVRGNFFSTIGVASLYKRRRLLNRFCITTVAGNLWNCCFRACWVIRFTVASIGPASHFPAQWKRNTDVQKFQDDVNWALAL
jgi:hypothetical protein